MGNGNYVTGVLEGKIIELDRNIRSATNPEFKEWCINKKAIIREAVDKLNDDVIVSGKYHYDPNRMGMHMIGNINLGDLLWENKDKYNNKQIELSLKEKR